MCARNAVAAVAYEMGVHHKETPWRLAVDGYLFRATPTAMALRLSGVEAGPRVETAPLP